MTTLLQLEFFVFQDKTIIFVNLMLFSYLCFVTTNANVYQRTKDTLLQNTFKTVSSPSRVVCCAYCDQTVDCMGVSYQISSKTCKFSTDPYVAVSVNGQMDNSWNTYSKNDWVLVFRATPGIGGDIYTAWVDGNDVTSHDVTCMSTDVTSCNKNYRSSIVDSWSLLEIKQVKFAYYKASVEVAFVVFDATGSNVTSWFSPSNIVQSTWTNLNTDTFNFFSVIGDDPGRRFQMSRNYGGCPNDAGYSVIVVTQVLPCSYDIQSSYPQFLYSTSATFGYPETMTGMDKADVMTIFIK